MMAGLTLRSEELQSILACINGIKKKIETEDKKSANIQTQHKESSVKRSIKTLLILAGAIWALWFGIKAYQLYVTLGLSPNDYDLWAIVRTLGIVFGPLVLAVIVVLTLRRSDSQRGSNRNSK
jgi:hypothetical protein